MAVILETSLGDITVDLYVDERPKCCENFLKLCKIKYYNWCLFHSVQRNLVAQTGDPTSTGRGGASIYAKLYGDQATFFDGEIKPRIKHKKKGTVSMVNNGSNMHGSQFFITLAPDIDYLDGSHTVFGEVAEAEGFETLDKINEAYVDQENRPYKDIRIYHTVVLDDPFDDMNGLDEYIPPASPSLTKEQLESDRIGAEEDIDPMKGKTEEEVQEEVSAKEAKANAQLLEMVGDLPDAEVNPEDNVLFVCKLNPVTTGEDLEIIFSRFGTILSCEVIKDQKTGESLQYAFIEFETNEQCENAYFKMDNVLIDDRRIHVDFSQSVAKLKHKQGQGRTVDAKQQYVIRSEKKKDAYDLVFSDNEDSEKRHEKKHKKDKNKKSKEDYRDRKMEHSNYRKRTDNSARRYDSRSRSRSPVDRRKGSMGSNYRRKRSQSPSYKRHSPVYRRSPSPKYGRRERDHEKRDKNYSKHDRREKKYRERSLSRERQKKKHKKDKYR